MFSVETIHEIGGDLPRCMAGHHVPVSEQPAAPPPPAAALVALAALAALSALMPFPPAVEPGEE